MNNEFKIAIDGPVAAGKSTVARKVAEWLGFVYVDTGAIYRALTLAAIRQSVSMEDEEALAQLAKEVDIDVRLPNDHEQDGRQSTVMLNEEDVSWQIRGGDVTKHVPNVASYPKVRQILVGLQQKISKGKNVVMEGRDITYVVLPDANLKIFLDAGEDERIERYYLGRRAKEKGWTKEQVRDWLKERDDKDKSREASPLRLMSGVWRLDTGGLSIDDVVGEVVRKVETLRT